MKRIQPLLMRSAFATLGLLAATAGMSCSLALEFDECQSDDDCANDGGDDLICNFDAQVCEPRPLPESVACDDPLACGAIFGDAATCGPEGRCAALASAECSKVITPSGAAPDEILWIGSILATSPPFDVSVGPIENAIELAIEDFNAVTSLPDGRKIGWVSCDSGGDPAVAKTAAEHLIEDVGVPAIIGPTTSEAVVALQELVVGSGTFLISPTATTASITDLDDSGLIWRTISSDVHQAAAIADRLPLLDPPPESVLILAKNDEYGRGLFTPTVERLSDVLPGVPTGSLLYPNPIGLSPNEIRSAYATVIADGFAQNADTIVFLGTSEIVEVLTAYLIAWDGAGIPLPRFVVSHGGVPVLLNALDIGEPEFRTTLMAALEGISPAVQDPENYEDFNIRYKVRFSDLSQLSSSPLGYDAAMVTLLGLVAAESTTGIDIARAIPRLADPTGTPLPFAGGQQFIVDARGLLDAGGNLDISGVSGALDFDLVTGEVRTNYVGWDVEPVSNGSTDGRLVGARQYTLEESGVGGAWNE